MKFTEFFEKAWQDHAVKTNEVAASLREGINQIDQPEQIAQMSSLIAHVFGEHLGLWEEGISALESLRNSPLLVKESEGDFAIGRSVATLRLASGQNHALGAFAPLEQIRILAAASAALIGQNKMAAAINFFQRALTLAESSAPDSPEKSAAQRSLAVTANNLTCTLEEKSPLTLGETEFMLTTARTARRYWRIVGTWLQVERAEYRLAMANLHAGRVAEALEHARDCLEIVQNNEASPVELFFAYEALALAEKANGKINNAIEAIEKMRRQFEKFSPKEQESFRNTLEKMDSPG